MAQVINTNSLSLLTQNNLNKTYNASKAAGHNFKAQPDLAEAAATTTENPLQKIDAALAQVDTLRSDLGAVQNRFNSASQRKLPFLIPEPV
ncbi:phase 1 flagellin [Salmonella enterica subsp. enterica serovar Uganda str. R8-3404]|uniref:Phase 1 flagellin n=1 Tax=Salmonella enterica subsp. enterica serovar Uganda str. R8-3404 TaxID=913083 RepID=A0A6C8H3P7_SALET|nr:phase 1 flagellin [Salmonella enterica subsp. enterica serovar Uganda str. R8-3404]